jgi:exodeoxyribonuclease V alpha subunit
MSILRLLTGQGLVERVTYRNAENGFCVVRVKARGHRELVTLARFLKTSAPTSVEGIEKYLASRMIRGIGPVYAKKLPSGARRWH